MDQYGVFLSEPRTKPHKLIELSSCKDYGKNRRAVNMGFWGFFRKEAPVN